MKKVFIGLLITAAGAAIFFLLQKKNNSINEATFKRISLSENGNWIRFIV